MFSLFKSNEEGKGLFSAVGVAAGLCCVSVPDIATAQSSRDVIAFLNDERILELIEPSAEKLADGTSFRIATSLLSDHEATLAYIINETAKENPDFAAEDVEEALNLIYFFASYPETAYMAGTEEERVRDYRVAEDILEETIQMVCPRNDTLNEFNRSFAKTCKILVARFE